MSVAGGRKVRTAVRISGVLWAIVLVIAGIVTLSPSPYESPSYNPLYLGLGGLPWLIVIGATGFVLVAAALWLLLFIADATRHAIRRVTARS